MLTVPTLASAVSLSKATCIDTTTLETNKTIYFYMGDGTQTNFTVQRQQNCTYACENGKCTGVDSGLGMVLMLGSLGVAALFLMLGFKTSKEHMALQTLFVVIGLLFLVNTTGTISSIAKTMGLESGTMKLVDTTATTSSYVLWVFMAYFIIAFLVSVLRGMQPKESFKSPEVIE